MRKPAHGDFRSQVFIEIEVKWKQKSCRLYLNSLEKDKKANSLRNDTNNFAFNLARVQWKKIQKNLNRKQSARVEKNFLKGNFVLTNRKVLV